MSTSHILYRFLHISNNTLGIRQKFNARSARLTRACISISFFKKVLSFVFRNIYGFILVYSFRFLNFFFLERYGEKLFIQLSNRSKLYCIERIVFWQFKIVLFGIIFLSRCAKIKCQNLFFEDSFFN